MAAIPIRTERFPDLLLAPVSCQRSRHRPCICHHRRSGCSSVLCWAQGTAALWQGGGSGVVMVRSGSAHPGACAAALGGSAHARSASRQRQGHWRERRGAAMKGERRS